MLGRLLKEKLLSEPVKLTCYECSILLALVDPEDYIANVPEFCKLVCEDCFSLIPNNSAIKTSTDNVQP